jgi:S1-C subfamily serine protease
MSDDPQTTDVDAQSVGPRLVSLTEGAVESDDDPTWASAVRGSTTADELDEITPTAAATKPVESTAAESTSAGSTTAGSTAGRTSATRTSATERRLAERRAASDSSATGSTSGAAGRAERRAAERRVLSSSTPSAPFDHLVDDEPKDHTTTPPGEAQRPKRSERRRAAKAAAAATSSAPASGARPSGSSRQVTPNSLTSQLSRRQARKLAKQMRKDARFHERVEKMASKRRHRILPRTVIGISALLLSFGLGSAISGVGLFMYYQDKTDSSIEATRGFSDRVNQSIAAIQAEGNNARAQVQNELEPLRRLAATGETLTNVLTAAAPSVWEVRTFGVDGGPVIASAFVVASDSDKSFLLSSYAVLEAVTRRPGPTVSVRKGDETLAAQLWTWDEQSDMALLIVEKGGLPRLDWAAPDAVRLGDQLFAMSGLGSKGAAITQGFVADVSSSGLQHSAPIGSTFEGGPLLSADGRVVAVASMRYAPFGARSTGAVSMAAPIRSACDKVLRCPNGQVTAAGNQR